MNQLPVTGPQPGTWSASQAPLLMGDWTSDLLIHRSVSKPLSYTSQGKKYYLFKKGIKILPAALHGYGMGTTPNSGLMSGLMITLGPGVWRDWLLTFQAGLNLTEQQRRFSVAVRKWARAGLPVWFEHSHWCRRRENLGFRISLPRSRAGGKRKGWDLKDVDNQAPNIVSVFITEAIMEKNQNFGGKSVNFHFCSVFKGLFHRAWESFPFQCLGLKVGIGPGPQLTFLTFLSTTLTWKPPVSHVESWVQSLALHLCPFSFPGSLSHLICRCEYYLFSKSSSKAWTIFSGKTTKTTHCFFKAPKHILLPFTARVIL